MRRQVGVLVFISVLLGALMSAALGGEMPATVPALLARVMVVRNVQSRVSQAVADDYLKRRGVRNVVDVNCPDSAANTDAETIGFAAYEKQIEAPVRAFLAGHPEVDFIVLTKGVPIRLADAPQGDGRGRLSLDSYLAALDYQKGPWAIRVDVTDPGYGKDFHGVAWANRYWNSDEPFSHAKFGGYLVTRLDGYTQADAEALTTHSLAAEAAAALPGQRRRGKILLDICPGFGEGKPEEQPTSILPLKPEAGTTAKILKESRYDEFNADMRLAARQLEARGVPVELETTDVFAGHREGLAGYVSWGSNDQKYDAGAYRSLSLRRARFVTRRFQPVRGRFYRRREGSR